MAATEGGSAPTAATAATTCIRASIIVPSIPDADIAAVVKLHDHCFEKNHACWLDSRVPADARALPHSKGTSLVVVVVVVGGGGGGCI